MGKRKSATAKTSSRSIVPTLYRQLTIDFDFVAAAFEPSEERRLRDIADDCNNIEEETAIGVVEAMLARGKLYDEAKELFGAKRQDVSWPKYCTQCLGYSKATVEQHAAVYKRLDGIDIAALAGVDPRAFPLFARKGVRKMQIERIAAMAKVERVTVNQVKQILGIEDDEQVKFKPNVPDNDESLREVLLKKIEAVRKRCDESVASHVPDVLRAIADDMNGVAEHEDDVNEKATEGATPF